MADQGIASDIAGNTLKALGLQEEVLSKGMSLKQKSRDNSCWTGQRPRTTPKQCIAKIEKWKAIAKETQMGVVDVRQENNFKDKNSG